MNVPFNVPPLENGDRLSREEFERRYGGDAECQELDDSALQQGNLPRIHDALQRGMRSQEHAEIFF